MLTGAPSHAVPLAPQIRGGCLPWSTSSAARSSSAPTSATICAPPSRHRPGQTGRRCATGWSRRLPPRPACSATGAQPQAPAPFASRLRLPTSRPTQALDDALATGDPLHVLLEAGRAAGRVGLDDLHLQSSPPTRRSLQAAPHRPPAARAGRPTVFRDRRGRVLYVGKAINPHPGAPRTQRATGRRGSPSCCGETERIDHVVRPGPLEAEVREVRPHPGAPPASTARAPAGAPTPVREAHLQRERFPDSSVVKAFPPLTAASTSARSRRRGRHGSSPRPSRASSPRRCTTRLSGRAWLDERPAREGPCTAAQLRGEHLPVLGAIGEVEYGALDGRACPRPSPTTRPRCSTRSPSGWRHWRSPSATRSCRRAGTAAAAWPGARPPRSATRRRSGGSASSCRRAPAWSCAYGRPVRRVAHRRARDARPGVPPCPSPSGGVDGPPTATPATGVVARPGLASGEPVAGRRGGRAACGPLARRAGRARPAGAQRAGLARRRRCPPTSLPAWLSLRS